MQTTTLGRTGLEVSQLGAGLVQIGDLSLNETDQASRILGSALDAGINFLDTAECYNNSEELIGKTVSHRRSEFILATKVGHISGNYLGKPWTGTTVRDSINRSLVRLNTDYVDIIQIHAYDITAPPPDEVIEEVLKAKTAGKTRFIGYSGENQDAEWAIQSGIFDTLQTAFNIVDQKARHGLFEIAKTHNIGIIAKRPLANGVWGMIPSVDAEKKLDGTNKERLMRARAMANIGEIHMAPEDPIVLSMGFTLAHEEVHTSIVGTGNLDHMIANIKAVEEKLPIEYSVVKELHKRFDDVQKNWYSID